MTTRGRIKNDGGKGHDGSGQLHGDALTKVRQLSRTAALASVQAGPDVVNRLDLRCVFGCSGNGVAFEPSRLFPATAEFVSACEIVAGNSHHKRSQHGSITPSGKAPETAVASD